MISIFIVRGTFALQFIIPTNWVYSCPFNDIICILRIFNFCLILFVIYDERDNNVGIIISISLQERSVQKFCSTNSFLK